MRFLSKLFSLSARSEVDLDQEMIDAAIERTVDGTDRRLRATADYRRRLRDPVERAVRYVISLVEELPAAAEISGNGFGRDPRVRSLFSSVEQLRDMLGGSRSLREFLEQGSPPRPARIHGVLVMEREQRTVLGTELEGDTIRRDVLQIAVNFVNHRFLTPTVSEAECLWELKKRAFDYLIERALERLISERIKRGELEHQRCLLRRKLEAMRAGQWGLRAMIEEPAAQMADITALETAIESIDQELGQFVGSALTLAQSLEQIAATLSHPAEWLAARRILLRLDHRGFCVSENSAASCIECELVELFSASGIRRTILPGWIPVDEIPERGDFLKKNAHYLA